MQGKTTLTRVLAGEGVPAGGTVTISGAVGYLPQDPRSGDLDQLARDRILAARGIHDARTRMMRAAERMASADDATRDKAMRRYSNAEAEFERLGGYAATSEGEAIASNLALPERVLDQPLRTLSGGQRRRVELARILYSGAPTLLLDEPTNHLDADSITWLRAFLKSFDGSVVVISHDVELLAATVNRVMHLDATRSVLEIYNMGWDELPQAARGRRASPPPRKGERREAGRRSAGSGGADALQGHQGQAGAGHAAPRRPTAVRYRERQADRVAKLRLPKPAPCGRVPLTASELSKYYGSLEVFTDVDLAIDRGSRVVILGLNGAGKTTLLRLLAGQDEPDTGMVEPGHGLKLGLLRPGARAVGHRRHGAGQHESSAADIAEQQARDVLGSFLFTGDDVQKPAGVLSGGEKTRLALAMLVVSGANVLLLDEPTNNLDPASREEILAALRDYEGAVVLVSHDEGAVAALTRNGCCCCPTASRITGTPTTAT